MDSTASTGAIVCADPTTTDEWIEAITTASTLANQIYVSWKFCNAK